MEKQIVITQMSSSEFSDAKNNGNSGVGDWQHKLLSNAAIENNDMEFQLLELSIKRSRATLRKRTFHRELKVSPDSLLPCLCTVCGSSFKQFRSLVKHFCLHKDIISTDQSQQDVDVDEKPHVEEVIKDDANVSLCTVCGETFSDLQTLSLHEKIHDREAQYNINVPKEENQLNRVESEIYQCDVCQLECHNATNLLEHVYLHYKSERYKCDFCPKSFRVAGNLSQHMRVHSDEKLFKCEVCDKRFAQSGTLNIHMRVHNRTKPFKCDLCGKCFADSSNLNKHIRIHTGSKPYVCNICGKCYRESGTLARHLRMHSGEKPYICSDCGKLFGYAGTLAMHRKSYCKAKSIHQPFDNNTDRLCMPDSL